MSTGTLWRNGRCGVTHALRRNGWSLADLWCQILDMADRNAPTRAERYRQLNLLERLPSTRVLDVAISAGLASFLNGVFKGDMATMKRSPLMRKLLIAIEAELSRAGIDTAHPVTRSRLKTRLRIPHQPVKRSTL